MTSFVNFKMQPTGPINSTKTLVFGNDLYTCILDGLLLSNLTNNSIQITLWLSRETDIGVETELILMNQVLIPENGKIDVLEGLSLTLEVGDLLYAASDFSSNIFNIFISYRELQESTPGLPYGLKRKLS